MLQAASIYTQGNGERWGTEQMFNIMLEIAKTSIQILYSDLYYQVQNKDA